MRFTPSRFIFCATALLWTSAASAQVSLNPSPARVLGHPQTALVTASPNLVEGRELFAPQGVAIDRTANPPILYVSDTWNNRVLGWRNATQFANGAPADVVIGQRDRFSTFALGPGTILSTGLNSPTGLAVDSEGNLFVADSGNNRVLRFPRPFANPDPVKLPDFVIGQTTMTTNAANAGGRSARTLALGVVVANRLVPSVPLFDAQGNLFLSDPGNGRVLRYPAFAVGPGAQNGPAADLVLGQASFDIAPQNPANATDLTRLQFPAGIAIDPSGRLYVADAAHRVVVYGASPPQGSPGQRYIGAVIGPQGNAKEQQPPDQRSLDTPEGIFLVGDVPFVLDSQNNRILRFPRFEDWPAAPTAPAATHVIGQEIFSGHLRNRGSVLPSVNLVSLARPIAAVVFEGELFVADSGNHRLLVTQDPTSLAPDALTPRRVLGQQFFDASSPNLVEGREFFFGGLGGVAVDLRSDPPHLYVADSQNHRVLGYRDARRVRPGDAADLVIGQPDLSKVLANYPSGDTLLPTSSSLVQPVGLAVDRDGNLYVADTGNGRVLRFPSPFQAGVNQPQADLVLGKANFVTPPAAAPDPSSTNMGAPYSLAFTVEGHLLVSDLLFNRVLLFFTPAGGDFTNGMAADRVFGQPSFFTREPGALENRMNGPRGISTDTDDRLYVCDTGNNRVQIFDRATGAGADPPPSLTLTCGGNNCAPGLLLQAPVSVFVSAATGEIWVSDQRTVSSRRRALRYPRFDLLIFDQNPEIVIASEASFEIPLDLALDTFGNLIVAYSTNRVAFYFPGMTPVNAANFLPRMAPGMFASLFPLGGRFGEVTEGAQVLPLPTEIAGLQVLVNDTPAPLFFVSPGQINFLMPKDLPTSGTVELQVVRPSVGQVLAVGCPAAQSGQNPDGSPRFICTAPSITMSRASPALFAGPGFATGIGQAAAVNEDGTVNSVDNAISRGRVIQFFGTGQGIIPNAPDDGHAPGGIFETPTKPRVFLGVTQVDPADVLFSGLSPEFPGLWQLNVRIPTAVPPGNNITVVIDHEGFQSNGTTQAEKQRIITTIAVRQ